MQRKGSLQIALQWTLLFCLTLTGFLDSRSGVLALVKAESKPALRRPVALVLDNQGKWLYVANHRSSTISVIDTVTAKPIVELKVGRRLSDLAGTSDGRHLVAVDEDGDEVVLIRCRGSALDVRDRLRVSPTPVSVQVAADGSRCFVASLWSRQLTIIDLAPGKSRTLKKVDLPFAPRRQLLVRDGTKLIVADSFGGLLGVVDVRRGELESVRSLPAHNIRGLALSVDGYRLLVTHQILNSRATTAQDDIHWGNLLTNNLRSLAVATVLAPEADLLRGSFVHYLGEATHGAGDPAAVAVDRTGKLVVALSGVGQVILGGESDREWQRLAVGRRPTAVIVSPDDRRAYVANTFGDSISVVDLKTSEVQAEIALGPAPALSPPDRGEMLFYDARLSHDGWMSCHSCHSDGHTTGLLNDNSSDGSFGTGKRILSLLGVRDTGPWAWNGSMPDLESQIRQSIQGTMQGGKATAEQVHDLMAYLTTLAPPPPWLPHRDRPDRGDARRGREVFEQQSCGTCHTPPAYTSRKTYDVGLSDETGNTVFTPPSLRGVGHGGPFFHDNRAGTLEEVFVRYQHRLRSPLTKQELEDLLAFLRSL